MKERSETALYEREHVERKDHLSTSIMQTDVTINVHRDFMCAFFKNKNEALEINVNESIGEDNNVSLQPQIQKMSFIPVPKKKLNEISTLELDWIPPSSRRIS